MRKHCSYPGKRWQGADGKLEEYTLSLKVGPSVFAVGFMLLFGRSLMSDPLQPHGLQHLRFPCLSLSPGACSHSRPLSWWCHPTISSCRPVSSCPQSFPASGSFPVSWLFTSGGQSIGASVSASVLPMNIQGWFPLGLTDLISLLSSWQFFTVYFGDLGSIQLEGWLEIIFIWFGSHKAKQKRALSVNRDTKQSESLILREFWPQPNNLNLFKHVGISKKRDTLWQVIYF